jgi:predicted transcriptional regulator
MMRNITFSAEDHLIDKAREIATREERTLNEVFREWLAGYVGREDIGERYDELMRQLSHVRAGRKYTREEMNERR